MTFVIFEAVMESWSPSTGLGAQTHQGGTLGSAACGLSVTFSSPWLSGSWVCKCLRVTVEWRRRAQVPDGVPLSPAGDSLSAGGIRAPQSRAPASCPGGSAGGVVLLGEAGLRGRRHPQQVPQHKAPSRSQSPRSCPAPTARSRVIGVAEKNAE